jgi:Domain of unknown function (DUF397)
MNVTAVAWRTSSYNGDNGGTCVEVGTTGLAVMVADTNQGLHWLWRTSLSVR